MGNTHTFHEPLPSNCRRYSHMHAGIVEGRQKADLFMSRSLDCNAGGRNTGHWSLYDAQAFRNHTCSLGTGCAAHSSLFNDSIGDDSLGDGRVWVRLTVLALRKKHGDGRYLTGGWEAGRGVPLFLWVTPADGIISDGLITHTTSTLTQTRRQSGLWS